MLFEKAPAFHGLSRVQLTGAGGRGVDSLITCHASLLYPLCASMFFSVQDHMCGSPVCVRCLCGLVISSSPRGPRLAGHTVCGRVRSTRVEVSGFRAAPLRPSSRTGASSPAPPCPAAIPTPSPRFREAVACLDFFQGEMCARGGGHFGALQSISKSTKRACVQTGLCVLGVGAGGMVGRRASTQRASVSQQYDGASLPAGKYAPVVTLPPPPFRLH